ncbi:MAG: DegT/DnrJ/EryC1/StrS family aminotransferase [Chitinophagia bacterium]|nr:DegT/DnrJ/EryC1/StrS family aminotransferase [Chitinophagia bacterium]
MTNLQMVDLKTQYLHIKPEIDAAIERVLDSAQFIGGSEVATFAMELGQYMECKHVIPCANGTDALQIALMALGLQPGDEVIVPSFTYMATAEVIALLRLTPVFIDVYPHTYTLSIEAVKVAITPRTKAIIAVHLYGQSADMEPLLNLANEAGIPVIEDNAQAIGGTYTFADGTVAKTGTMGTIGTTSFFPSKNLGGYGDGGALFTNDDSLAEKLKMIANHGQRSRYLHEIVGCNSRLDAIQAAILRVKLQKLEQYNQARRKAAYLYNILLVGHPDITVPHEAVNRRHVYHQYTLQIGNYKDRNEVQRLLAERGIPTMIYYPIPCHKQPMLSPYNVADTPLPVTDFLQHNVLSLPIHTELNEAIQNHIVTQLKEVLATL